MKDSYWAFIPARGGSKGIPRKNIKLFCGRPLVYWTIKAAVESPSIEKIYVATEDEEIRKVVDEFGFAKVSTVSRSLETATDEASSEVVLIDFLSRYSCDKVVFIQATSPLLRSSDLEFALQKYKRLNSDSMLSVFRSHRFIWRSEGRDSFASPLNYDPRNRPRRQDWGGELIENGAFYISSRERILETGCRISGEISFFEMSSEDSVEIDSDHDWSFCESIMRKRQRSAFGRAVRAILPNLLISDVDGTLTDAGMYTSDDGQIHKRFNTRDGHGLAQLRALGVKVMFLTSENSPAVIARGEKLQIDYVGTGIKDKVKYLNNFFHEHPEHSWERSVYIGDDVNDLESLKRVGFSACPNDAHPCVASVVQMVCERRGGEACVRELCDVIVKELSDK